MTQTYKVILAVLGLSLMGTPAALEAQEVPLADLLSDLILREITLPSSSAPGLSHSVHFSPLTADDLANPAVTIVQSFNTLMATQFSTFPLGSSTGGFTYTFDETLGTFRRGSSSFGPSFTERAITVGRGQLSVGFNYQHTRYDSFEGESLDDGSIRFFLRHEECCSVGPGPPVPPFFGVVEVPDGTRESPFFEGDLIEAALSLDATTDTVALFANYGVTDRWDVGVAIPFLRVDLEASVNARIVRLSTGTIPTIHTFEAGDPLATERVFTRSGSASGVGDVVVRTKYNFLRQGNGGLAAALDLRLPTGNADELLGSGGTQAKFFFIASAESGRFGQHINIGYTVASGDVGGDLGPVIAPQLNTNLPDEFNYAGGVEFVVHPRLTLIGDIVGRTLRDVGRLDLATKSFSFQLPGPPADPAPSTQFDEFQPRTGSLNLVLGAAGLKFNLTGNLLISGSVLFPLTDAGLRSQLTTVVGLDYAFR